MFPLYIITITFFSKNNTLRQWVLKSKHLLPWLMIHIQYRECYLAFSLFCNKKSLVMVMRVGELLLNIRMLTLSNFNSYYLLISNFGLQFQPRGYECRDAVNGCDITEYCTGDSGQVWQTQF